VRPVSAFEAGSELLPCQAQFVRLGRATPGSVLWKGNQRDLASMNQGYGRSGDAWRMRRQPALNPELSHARVVAQERQLRLLGIEIGQDVVRARQLLQGLEAPPPVTERRVDKNLMPR